MIDEKKTKIIFKNGQSPGDIVMLTAAIRDLHLAHPEKFLTDIRTPCPDIWENNPYITHLEEGDDDVVVLDDDYPLIHSSNTVPYHFIHAFTQLLEDKLGVTIRMTQFKGDIHISDEEDSWLSQVEETGFKKDYWVVFAGGKYDFTCKWTDPSVIQSVVDHFLGRITFVQAGSEEHWHPRLKNVIDFIGKTNLRQLIRLIYHSVGVLCPVTFGMHAAAAVPVKSGRPLNRACVVIAGGREPMQWEAYPHHRFLSTNGCLSCCDNGGCWTSRCQKVGDGDEKDEKHLCLQPVKVSKDLVIPKCINMIKPNDIIRAIEMYYEGGALKYND